MPAMSKSASQAEAREILAQTEDLKKRAARQAMKTQALVEVPSVECVILPAGDGKVSMGEHFATLGDAHYEEGEKVSLQLPVALNLYARGYVNFEGAKQAMEDDRAARAEDARNRARAAEDARREAERAEYA